MHQGQQAPLVARGGDIPLTFSSDQRDAKDHQSQHELHTNFGVVAAISSSAA
jgi:hypothetical protein